MRKGWIAALCLFSAASLFSEEELLAKCEVLRPSGKQGSEEKQQSMFFHSRSSKSKNHQKEAGCSEMSVCDQPAPLEETLPCGTITPPVLPNVRCGSNVFGWVDFIWWKSFLERTAYASTGMADNVFAPFGQNVQRGETMYPDFHFSPGFQIGLGTFLWHDGWSLSANYTWLRFNGSNSISAKNGSGLGSPFFIASPEEDQLFNLAQNASSRFHQSFNMLDLELGRKFFVSRYLTLRPHLGMKGALIYQTFQYDYQLIPNFYQVSNGGITFPLVNAMVKNIQNSGSIGIRSGLDTEWLIWKHLGIYGNLAASLLWSDFHSHNRQATGAQHLGTTTNLHVLNATQRLTPVLELELGLDYAVWMSQDQYRLEFFAGWEEQIWWDFNQTDGGNLSLTDGGNLSLYGLTTGMNFTF